MGNVTIKQIAELAGVSRGTVDRALNNRGGVNAEVLERIKKIADELSYSPNLIAKALANSKRRLNVCVLINSGENPFFIDVMNGIKTAEQEISKYGVALEIKTLSGYEIDEQLSALQNIQTQEYNGLIITPINNKKIASKLNEIASNGTSIITLNSDISAIDKLCFVGCDYKKSGQTAAELLGRMMPLGGKVGIVTGSLNMLGHNERIAGFKGVVSGNYPKIQVTAIVEGNDDDKVSYTNTKKMLLTNEIDAVYFCAGGIDGGIKAVKEHDRDISIITVDDAGNIKNYVYDGTITATVCQEPHRQGYQAVMLMFEYLINGKKPPRKHIYMNNEIKLKYNID